MSANPNQPPLPGIDADETAEIEAGYVWREALYSGCRACVSALGGYDVAAAALDRRWGAKGRPVSASTLRACLNDAERNNARMEWLDFFGARSEEVARLMARRVRLAKTIEEQLEDLRAEVRDELSHKRAEQLIRKAQVR